MEEIYKIVKLKEIKNFEIDVLNNIKEIIKEAKDNASFKDENHVFNFKFYLKIISIRYKEMTVNVNNDNINLVNDWCYLFAERFVDKLPELYMIEKFLTKNLNEKIDFDLKVETENQNDLGQSSNKYSLNTPDDQYGRLRRTKNKNNSINPYQNLTEIMKYSMTSGIDKWLSGFQEFFITHIEGWTLW